jgi:hypothetical protein
MPPKMAAWERPIVWHYIIFLSTLINLVVVWFR